MAQSLCKIVVHIVFSTKKRVRLIAPQIAPDLHGYLAGACRSLGSEAYRVGGIEDHVHLACGLPRTLPVSKLIEQIKMTSSRWIKQHDPKAIGFAWQSGYAAFSVGQSQLPSLIDYIDGQREHHHNIPFEDELRALLEKYKIPYDERFLWD